jgi:cathepsin L
MLAAFLAVGSCALVAAHEEKSFVAHLRQNGLLYTGDEYQFRLGIFLTSQRIVRDFNAGNHGFRLGTNSLSTLTPAEYRLLLGYKLQKQPKSKFGKKLHPKANSDYPPSYDWRQFSAVQIVKDQGQCGSDWAFGAIGAEESMFFINKGMLYNLSEQNLVDCDRFDSGCDGGTAENAYEYVLGFQDGHFATEVEYPYTGVEGTCYYDATNMSGSAYLYNYGWFADPGQDAEANLLALIYEYGPAACAIDASHDSFQLYSSGIFNEPACSSTDLDHEVLNVGYGADDSGTQYWIVKNSWGTGWGVDGYIYMSRNKNNQCGITTDVTVPLLNF